MSDPKSQLVKETMAEYPNPVSDPLILYDPLEGEYDVCGALVHKLDYEDPGADIDFFATVLTDVNPSLNWYLAFSYTMCVIDKSCEEDFGKAWRLLDEAVTLSGFEAQTQLARAESKLVKWLQYEYYEMVLSGTCSVGATLTLHMGYKTYFPTESELIDGLRGQNPLLDWNSAEDFARKIRRLDDVGFMTEAWWQLDTALLYG